MGLVDTQKMLLYPHPNNSNPRPVALDNSYFKKYFAMPPFYPRISAIYVDSSGKKHTKYEF